MDNKEYIQSLVAKAKEAQAILDTFSQEKIDELTKAIGMAIFDAAQMLSEEAVAETKYGTVESKVGKHKGVTTATWWAVCGKPSVGLIEDTKDVDGILKFAKPLIYPILKKLDLLILFVEHTADFFLQQNRVPPLFFTVALRGADQPSAKLGNNGVAACI